MSMGTSATIDKIRPARCTCAFQRMLERRAAACVSSGSDLGPATPTAGSVLPRTLAARAAATIKARAWGEDMSDTAY